MTPDSGFSFVEDADWKTGRRTYEGAGSQLPRQNLWRLHSRSHGPGDPDRHHQAPHPAASEETADCDRVCRAPGQNWPRVQGRRGGPESTVPDLGCFCFSIKYVHSVIYSNDFFFLHFSTRTGIQRPLWERRELKPPMRAKRKKERRKKRKKMQRKGKNKYLGIVNWKINIIAFW